MRRPPEDEGRRWMDQAERDLDDARYSAKGERCSLACFLSQQAAEKALKGFLYSRGAENVWGHSVAELCADAAEADPAFGEMTPRAGGLDKYYIPTRYPNGLPGGIPADAFNSRDASMAIALAQETLDLCRARASEQGGA